MKLSVIIPVYNVEKYINRAVESIIKQNFTDLEIILINDGSTDNSLQEINLLSKKYENIKVFTQENQGVSSTRNLGIKKAQGEYICFLDADDYLEDGVLNKFYSLCKESNLDVIRGAYKIYSEEKNDFLSHNPPTFPYLNKVLSGTEFLDYSMKYHFNEVVPWLGLFKRQYILDNDLFFPNGISYEEDQLMFLKAMLSGGKFMQVQDYFITYVYRKYSCTKNLDFKKAEDVAYIVQEEKRYINSLNLCRKTYKSALKYISSSFYQLTSIYGRVDKSLRKKCVKLVPFILRVKLTFNPYNSYHFKKIFLFNFCRIILDFYYNRNI